MATGCCAVSVFRDGVDVDVVGFVRLVTENIKG